MSFTSTVIKGLVSRILPSYNPDSSNNDISVRLGRYGEVMTMPAVRKAHTLGDEGTYFVTTNNQTGVVSTYNTSYTNTAPFVLVQNTASVASGIQVYLDYISLTCTVAGAAASAGVAINATLVVDNGLRYTSGGTNITTNLQSVNMNNSQAHSVSGVYIGAIVSPAPTTAARTIVGIRNIRPALSTTVLSVVGDQHNINFGGVEGGAGGFLTITAGIPSIVPVAFPPVILGPQQSAALHVWFNATTPSAWAAAAEVGVWER